MQYTKLGSTGLTVSRQCLGTMSFGFKSDEAVSKRMLDQSTDNGVTFIDTADVYPSGGDLTTSTCTGCISMIRTRRWTKLSRRSMS